MSAFFNKILLTNINFKKSCHKSCLNNKILNLKLSKSNQNDQFEEKIDNTFDIFV